MSNYIICRIFGIRPTRYPAKETGYPANVTGNPAKETGYPANVAGNLKPKRARYPVQP